MGVHRVNPHDQGPVPYSALRPADDFPALMSCLIFVWSIPRRVGKSLMETSASALFAQDGSHTAEGPDASSSSRHLGGSTRVWEDTQSWASLEQLWLSNL